MRNTKNILKIKSILTVIVFFVVVSARMVISAEDNSESDLIKAHGQSLEVMERADYHGYAGFVTSVLSS